MNTSYSDEKLLEKLRRYALTKGNQECSLERHWGHQGHQDPKAHQGHQDHQGSKGHQGLRMILETSNASMGGVKILKVGGGDHI